jgi:hypothetical protein
MLKLIKDEGLYLHYFISLVIVIALSFMLSLFWSCLITLAIGIIKEMIDKYIRKAKFSLLDLVADVAGILTGLLLVSMFYSWIDKIEG